MIDDDRSDVRDIIADMVRELTPIHAVMADFERGGPARAQWVERLHGRLTDLAQRVRGLEAAADDDDADDDDEAQTTAKGGQA